MFQRRQIITVSVFFLLTSILISGCITDMDDNSNERDNNNSEGNENNGEGNDNNSEGEVHYIYAMY